MATDPNELHPNDVRLFKTISDAMAHTARRYELPLKEVIPHPEPEYATAPLGDCSPSTGVIRIVLRGKSDGTWDHDPLPEKEAWETAAHELAHLRFPNHGLQFQEFELEMKQAMENRRVNYQQKVIDRLVKLQAQRESEAKIGNSEAAEAFAGMINKMLIEHELNPSDIDYARATDNDPVIELTCDLSKYSEGRYDKFMTPKKSRIAWQETLAGVVARGNLCSFLIQLGSNNITFVGTRTHATVAEYLYGNLVRSATIMSLDARVQYHQNLRAQNRPSHEGRGFRESWLTAFVGRIDERLREARAAAVREVSADINVQNMGLMRLNQALVKTQQYLADKFGTKQRYANALKGGGTYHADGREAGRAAADRMNIGRRGLDRSTTKGYLE